MVGGMGFTGFFFACRQKPLGRFGIRRLAVQRGICNGARRADSAQNVQFIRVKQNFRFKGLGGILFATETMGADTVLHRFNIGFRPPFFLQHFSCKQG